MIGFFQRFFSPAPAKDQKTRDPKEAAWIGLAWAFGALAARIEGEQAESEYVKTLLNTVPRPLWTQKRGKITWCNTAYGMAAGLCPTEVVVQQRHLAPPTASKNGSDEKNRTTFVSGGKRRVMDILRVPIPAMGPHDGRKEECFLGIALDASREDEMERAAQRHRAVYNELLEHLRSSVAIYDGDQRLDFYNTAFAQLWGLPEQWLNTRPRLGEIMDRLRETRRLPEQADFQRFKAGWLGMFTDLIEPLDDMLHLPDGTSLRFLVIAHPMGGLMMIFEDVTSRLALESSYNTLVAVQRETLDALAEGVAVFAGDGRLQLFNPSFGILWGLSPELLASNPHISELSGKMAQRLPFGARGDGKTLLRTIALDRHESEGQFLCATLRSGLMGGSSVHLAYATTPLPDGGVMVTFRDVSDAAHAAQALEDKARALEAAEELKADFLANVSYQLRTPLSTMMGFADILREGYFGTLNDKQKEYADGLNMAGQELLRLIDDILDLATIEAGYMDLKPEEVEVRPMLQNLLQMVQGWVHTSHADISLDCPPNPLLVWCDAQRIRQAMLNLVRNALAYTPPGGRVILGGRVNKGGGMRLFVADGGPGIAPEDRVRIFRPFERAAQPRGGAGLGLTLVKSIVDLHGGHIDITSNPGKGTIATLILPPRPVFKNHKEVINHA